MSLKDLVREIGLPQSLHDVVPEKWVKPEDGVELITATLEGDKLSVQGDMTFDIDIPISVMSELLATASKRETGASHGSDEITKLIMERVFLDMAIDLIPEMQSKIASALGKHLAHVCTG